MESSTINQTAINQIYMASISLPPVRGLVGSMFAGSVAEALSRSEIFGESEEEPFTNPTFGPLTDTIRNILVKETDENSTLIEVPSLAGQDDVWGADALVKSGSSLYTNKDRYEALGISHQG